MRRKHYLDAMKHPSLPKAYKEFIEGQYNKQLKYGITDSMPREQVMWRLKTAWKQQLYVAIVYEETNEIKDARGVIIDLRKSNYTLKTKDGEFTGFNSQVLDIQETNKE